MLHCNYTIFFISNYKQLSKLLRIQFVNIINSVNISINNTKFLLRLKIFDKHEFLRNKENITKLLPPCILLYYIFKN